MTQTEALTILKTGANVFLTGEPGSGKTFVVNEYVHWLRASGVEPAITAATGIAATQVSGMTIHAWSGIGILERASEADVDRIASKEHVARRIAKAKVLIIDEISMLSADALQSVDAVCKEIRRRQEAFGGLQVVLVGDFFQLPPVAKQGREVRFCYDSSAWRELAPLVCYLTEQHRQEDGAYLEVLTAIRRAEVEEVHYERINARRTERGATLPGVPKLYSHNADVDRENAAALAQLPGKPHRFLMKSQGAPNLIEALKRGCLSPEALELKEGAAVMFTKNAPQGRFVNGTLGTLVEFNAGGMPVVETRAGDYITAELMDWQVEENGKIRASVSQVPLRLAYAMTVHKSQGQSLDAAAIDLSQAFEYGQGYVALSRVRTLAGLHLLGINQRALEVHPGILEKDREFRELSELTRETFNRLLGKELLEMQQQFIRAVGGAWQEGKKKKKRGATGAMPERLAQTLQAVREAHDLREVAKERGLAVSTIIGHLEDLHKAKILLREDFMHFLPDPDALSDIQDAWREVGGEKLTPVFKKLGGRYSFESIRLARLALE